MADQMIEKVVDKVEPEKIEPAKEPTTYAFGGKTYDTVDALGKAYESLQSEHGKWTNKYGDLEKQYKDANEKVQKWGDWWGRVQPHWGDDVEALLRAKSEGKAAPTQRAAQPVQAQDQFAGFELLSPQEQYGKMQQMMSEDLGKQFSGRLGDLARAVQDTLTQKEQWYTTYLQNHLGLLRKALEKKFENPAFNIDQTMEMAAKAIGGQMDPILLGQQLIDAQTFQTQLEAAKKAAYTQGKKDFEQELANKKQEIVPPTGVVPTYKMPGIGANGKRQGLASMRQTAAENIFKRFGPEWFRE